MLKFESYRVSDINDCSFKKAIIEPENVIAPTTNPIDISTALTTLISLPRNTKFFGEWAPASTNTA